MAFGVLNDYGKIIVSIFSGYCHLRHAQKGLNKCR